MITKIISGGQTVEQGDVVKILRLKAFALAFTRVMELPLLG
jgi:hypothetical protein